MRLRVFVRTDVFAQLGYTPRSARAESNGNSVFDLLRNCRTFFQSGCIISPKQGMRGLTSPQPFLPRERLHLPASCQCGVAERLSSAPGMGADCGAWCFGVIAGKHEGSLSPFSLPRGLEGQKQVPWAQRPCSPLGTAGSSTALGHASGPRDGGSLWEQQGPPQPWTTRLRTAARMRTTCLPC